MNDMDDDVYGNFPEVKQMVDAVYAAIRDVDDNRKLCVLGVCTATIIQRMAPRRRDRELGSFVRMLALTTDEPDDDE